MGNPLLHAGHARHAAYKEDIVNLVGPDTGIAEGCLAGEFEPVDERGCEFIQLHPGERVGEVARTGLVDGKEGEIDVGLVERREFALGRLGGLAQALKRHLVCGDVDAGALFEDGHEAPEDGAVEVVAAEGVVTAGRDDLVDAAAQAKDGDVKGAAA